MYTSGALMKFSFKNIAVWCEENKTKLHCWEWQENMSLISVGGHKL